MVGELVVGAFPKVQVIVAIIKTGARVGVGVGVGVGAAAGARVQ